MRVPSRATPGAELCHPVENIGVGGARMIDGHGGPVASPHDMNAGERHSLTCCDHGSTAAEGREKIDDVATEQLLEITLHTTERSNAPEYGSALLPVRSQQSGIGRDMPVVGGVRGMVDEEDA